MVDLTIARKHIEKLYVDTCNVVEHQVITDPTTKISGMQEITVYENVPCKISYQTVKPSGEGVGGSLFLSAKLICSPDIEIKPGSRIDVTRNGKTTAYKNSGEPARHVNHQEIMLELFDGWA